MENKPNKPPIIQSFDHYIDREYFKITQGFFSKSNTLVRADRLKEWNEWEIHCEQMPDKVIINGKEYTLIEN